MDQVLWKSREAWVEKLEAGTDESQDMDTATLFIRWYDEPNLFESLEIEVPKETLHLRDEVTVEVKIKQKETETACV